MADDLLQRLDLLGRDNQIPICTLAAARIRELEAQIAAPSPQPVAVRVKPLEWGSLGDNYAAFDPLFEITAITDKTAEYDRERAARILATIEAAPAADLPARDAHALANPKVRALVEAAKEMRSIVEGIQGAMEHGTFRAEKGMRLKDTPEWVALYLAITAMEKETKP